MSATAPCHPTGDPTDVQTVEVHVHAFPLEATAR